jgi:hypothetical protein
MKHCERFLLHQGFPEVVEAQISFSHFGLERLLGLDAPGVPDSLADYIANGTPFQIDDQRATAPEFAVPALRKPALRDLDHHVRALLPVRSDPTDRAHRMNFEIAKSSSRAAYRERLAFTAVETEGVRIGIVNAIALKEGVNLTSILL